MAISGNGRLGNGRLPGCAGSSRRKATREGQPKASQGGLDRFGAEGGLLASGRAGARDGRGPWVGLSGLFDTSEYEAIAREAQVLNSVPRLLQGKEGKIREGLPFLPREVTVRQTVDRATKTRATKRRKETRLYDRRASRRGSVMELVRPAP